MRSLVLSSKSTKNKGADLYVSITLIFRLSVLVRGWINATVAKVQPLSDVPQIATPVLGATSFIDNKIVGQKIIYTPLNKRIIFKNVVFKNASKDKKCIQFTYFLTIIIKPNANLLFFIIVATLVVPTDKRRRNNRTGYVLPT
ncbi:hypothetical protein EGR_05867 [Echinococcus granulosus]|uniref:Uncharacterized protein n=1 Tax=Echinococcus granulosus TaxID=6210 RepID=W6UED4_ECHGR|nr:hypothetical protein EGR_05867 [Echinococcus granulosus]EUB59266.1 hypothetical protein EGR_05867 [Echinococcus granulosus]